MLLLSVLFLGVFFFLEYFFPGLALKWRILHLTEFLGINFIMGQQLISLNLHFDFLYKQ